MPRTIEITDLTYCYPDGTLALDSLDLSIPLPSRTAVLGANGCGKTTLLRHLNGLLMPSSGSLSVDGRPLTKQTAPELRKSVGLLFDDPDIQLFAPSVAADVSFGPANLRLGREETDRRVEAALATVDLTDLRDKSPYNLSLGQKKRCAIAGVLAMEPHILLLDEPFTGLDPAALRQLLATLDRLYTDGVTQIVSTHDVDLAYEWADFFVIMSKGRVLASGGRELLQDEDLLQTAALEPPFLVRLFKDKERIPQSLAEARELLNDRK